MENLTEFPAVLQKGKGKGKSHLLQSRGSTFWLHSSSLAITRSEEMNVSIFQTTASSTNSNTNSSFLYSVHVKADRAPTTRLQDLRASPPVSTFLDHPTHSDSRESALITMHRLQRKILPLRTRPEENAVSHRLLWLNETPKTGGPAKTDYSFLSGKSCSKSSSSHLNFMPKAI